MRPHPLSNQPLGMGERQAHAIVVVIEANLEGIEDDARRDGIGADSLHVTGEKLAGDQFHRSGVSPGLAGIDVDTLVPGYLGCVQG